MFNLIDHSTFFVNILIFIEVLIIAPLPYLAGSISLHLFRFIFKIYEDENTNKEQIRTLFSERLVDTKKLLIGSLISLLGIESVKYIMTRIEDLPAKYTIHHCEYSQQLSLNNIILIAVILIGLSIYSFSLLERKYRGEKK